MKENQQLLEEYKMLRSEITYFMNKDTTLLTCLFSTVTATLFFSLKEGIIEGCILAFLIIMPICNKFVYHQRQMAKISTYIICYLEKKLSIKWETRIMEMKETRKNKDCENEKNKKAEIKGAGRVFKFSECMMMALASVISYTYLAWDTKFWEENKYLFFFETILICLLFVATLVMTLRIYKMGQYRKKYEKKWKMLEGED